MDQSFAAYQGQMPCYVEHVAGLLNDCSFQLCLYSSKVPAGFPSPADEHIEDKLDLNEHLIKHPAATFFVRAAGHSMVEAGIHDGDLLIVDRSIKPVDGRVVIAAIDGQLTVKRINLRNGMLVLSPENSKYEPIEVKEGSDVHIWGVVTSVVHKV